jgi:hypothetical protein
VGEGAVRQEGVENTMLGRADSDMKTRNVNAILTLSGSHSCQQGVDGLVTGKIAYSALGLGAFTRRLWRYHL